ncbi:potassium/proton antiporter [Rhodoferax sp.]|uniref:potassium/proton antiporter n=1 Tax=Rhodoferax sp. TaxID=50421 RepID=UPI002732134F|nr:potassium/proton antiporter [Rhodoferax sp.]MDP1529965.1 potassium/proton antiporter [Rhodoferax sp.]MDP1942738.1 potassium/proton antiporter [Rhodoferax sp.]MDP2443447.1 potassium/proton antiporter [Rhodoferax sp.]MDZ4206304.1 potassium/proton antiporter [Rhodoferax sp.]
MNLNLDFLSLPLLGASALIFTSVLVGVFSKRAGFSFLLAFLVTGMLAGVDGPGGWEFSDYRVSFWVGNIALVIILLDGGLRTDYPRFRTGLKPALLLASLGVVLTAGFTAVAAVWLLKLNWTSALLLGAIVGSTDAAAVFSLLKTSGVQLNERVATTLEIESGMNDPMAVYLTLALIGLASVAGAGASLSAADIAWSLLAQFGWGALLGIGIGRVFALVLPRIHQLEESGAVIALLLAMAGLSTFALTTWVGGSGFLAVYLLGIVLNRRAPAIVQSALSALDGYAWLSQALMFVLLGLLVTPSEIEGFAWPALGVAAVLMFVARPLAVGLCLAPLRFKPKEIVYIAWVGLRGAVPIVLAIFPFMANLPDARLIFNVAFVVVLASLLLQGSTIGWFAHRMGVILPDKNDASAVRATFGDFALQANTRVADLCEVYGLQPPPDADLRVDTWLAKAIMRPVVVGDQVALDGAKLSVRTMSEGVVTSVGLKLPSSSEPMDESA